MIIFCKSEEVDEYKNDIILSLVFKILHFKSERSLHHLASQCGFNDSKDLQLHPKSE